MPIVLHNLVKRHMYYIKQILSVVHKLSYTLMDVRERIQGVPCKRSEHGPWLAAPLLSSRRAGTRI